MLWEPFFSVQQVTAGKNEPIDVVRSNPRPGLREDDQYRERFANEWTNERTNELTNERMNEWTNERMNEWTNERMNEWMNEWMSEWVNNNFIPFLQTNKQQQKIHLSF